MNASGKLKPLIVFIAATMFCGIVVYLGPKLATAWLPLVDDPDHPNYPLIDTFFPGVIFGLLLLLALVGAALCRVNPLRPGRKPVGMAALGAGIGIMGVVTATGYAWIARSLVNMHGAPTTATLFLWGSAVILFQSATEEIYFRGWLQPVLVAGWGVWPGIFFTTLAFALLHLIGGAETLFAVLNLFLGGLLFGLLAARSGGIAASVAAHFGWNWVEQMVLGLFPNPGTGSFSALVDLDLIGPARWGGSSEGLNASVGMTFALVALLVPLLILWSGGRRLTTPAST